jgi:DNA polymerase III delta prime subunit
MNNQSIGLDDLIGLEEIKDYLYSLRNAPETIPHLFFYGNPGTGKTSTINAFLNDLGVDGDHIHFFNLSYKNCVEFVRTRIMNLCRLKNRDGQEISQRFIILDEFDSLTTDSQPYISYCMRKYPNVRFCMISNTINDIIPSILNNSKLLHFDYYKDDDYKDLIRNISNRRNIKKICRIGCYDMRKIVKIKDIYLPILDRPLDEDLLTRDANQQEVFRYISQKLSDGYDYDYIFSFYKNQVHNWMAKKQLSDIEYWFSKNINYRNVVPSLTIAIHKMRSLVSKFP